MQQLVKVTQSALAGEETRLRSIEQRNLVSDALRLLNKHQGELVKGYPMALLEIFAEGPSLSKGRAAEDTGMDFGELSLMDEHEMQAQVELSKAQQSALHATDAVLAELNTLVSSAQGLRSVQPERNPLRPESYIRALQRVVGDTGVVPEVRQLWMQHMRDLLGQLLVDEYKKTAASLREHGIQPVGYAVLGTPSGAGRGGYGGVAGPNTSMGTGYGSGYSGYGSSMMPAPAAEYGATGYGRGGGGGAVWGSDSLQQPMVPAAAAEEALLTVGILRQMLAGGDPFDPRSYGGVPSQPVSLQQAWPAVPMVGAPQAVGHGGYVPASAAAEAIEDMAQLERLVGRLAGAGSQPASLSAPLTGWRGPGVSPIVYAAVPMEAATQSAAVAMDVVGRMMEHIAQDSRLLPPVREAVKSLEPALKQLVQHDSRFFSDGTHPARRLLDELTERSLAFTSETAPGFSRFMRLVQGAVEHLAGAEIKDAGPFDTVLKALHSAWEAQERKAKAQQEAQQKALLQAEQREMLAEKIAADIRKLPDLENVPSDVLDFAAGPWADVIALAQMGKAEGDPEEDPGGYLALVPLLLWSAQPELTRQEPERLTEAIPGLLAKLRKGLKTINYPAAQASALLQRLVSLHQAAFEQPAVAWAPAALPPEPEPEPAPPQAEAVPVAVAADPVPVDVLLPPPEPAPDPYADFVLGAWVELITNGRTVRTQLTWASPHGTLFLFTAADASTQSMTRRMRDKLASEGLLRVVPAAAPTTARALEAGAGAAPRKAAAGGAPKSSSSAKASQKAR